MSLRPAVVLLTSITLALILVVPASTPRAQETTPPEDQPATPAETPATPEEAPPVPPPDPSAYASWLQDRIMVRGGYGAMIVRGSSRGTTIREETQVEPLSVEQIQNVNFDSTTEFGYMLDFSYRIGRRWFVTGDFFITSGKDETYTDTRDIGNIDDTGDFLLARFESDYESDYTEWSIGGAFRAFPFKPHDDPRFFVDALLQFRKAEANYTFNSGEMIANPFSPTAFSEPRFDPMGRDQASFDMEHEALQAGVRLGWNLSQRFTLDFLFLPTIFGRYEGTADLQGHGIVFEHAQGTAHTDPVFHTPNCDSDDPPSAGTPACAGLVDGDLRNPTLVVDQDSNRGSGLRLDMNLDIKFTEMFSLSVGYHRQDFRSVGGEHEKTFGDDSGAGCQDPNPRVVNGVIVEVPRCIDEVGDLGQASITTQSFYVAGRFTWN